MKIFATLIAMFMAIGANAQVDVFGSKVPKGKEYKVKSVQLPDYPNKVDSLGRRQGKWARKYENGHYAYTAEFVDGQPVGVVKRFTEQGNLETELFYEAGNDTIRAVLYNPLNKVEAMGFYIGKIRVGKWQFFDQQGALITIQNYAGGKLHGEQVTLTNKGYLAERINYNMGELEGEWIQYYNGGKIKMKANYKAGKLDGVYMVNCELSNQIAVKGMYKNGVQVGDWQYFDEISKDCYVLKYNEKGVLLNPEVRAERMNNQYHYYDKKKQGLEDPANYRPEY